MTLKLPSVIRRVIRSTGFWQDNYLILREFKHFRWTIVFAIALTFSSVSLEGSTVGLVASFLQGVTNPSESPIQTGVNWFDIWVLASEAPTSERICRLAAFIMVITWLRSGFSYWGSYYFRTLEFGILDRIRKQIFHQLQSLSLSYYSTIRSGDLINSITNQLNDVQRAFSHISSMLIRSATLLIYIMSMFWISWQLSVASIMLYCLLAVGVSNMVTRVRETSFEVPKAEGNLSSIIIELIQGIRTIKASVAQDFEHKRFYEASNQVVIAKTRVSAKSELIKPITEAVSTTILILTVTASFLIFVSRGELRAASLLTFMFVLFRMMPLVTQLSSFLGRIAGYQGALSNVQELLKTDDKPYLINGDIQFSGLKQSIDFESVDFCYNSSDSVLEKITLSIKKGETTALVGASGAGKTTLADLIPRFHDPTHGKILIDGINLHEFDVNSLRREMAIVSQDTFIFNTSVKENIAYGQEIVDEAKVKEAAKLANAWEFIQELPDGLETRLGDRGVRLSGGQRQRIAIARALLSNPKILILDEATSALDSVTERLIQESLERLSKGRTVIAIAHRLSTIVRADKVVVLERGQIVEHGGYQELLERRGKLWKYHQMQFKGETADINKSNATGLAQLK